MFKNVSIRVRLALAMSFLGALLIVGGVMGVAGVSMSNADLQELYSNDLASSAALGRASVSLARARLFLFRIALDPTSSGVPEQTENARDQLAASKKAWDAYRALSFSGPDEARRAADVNAKFDALVAKGTEPMFSAIATHDAAKITDVTLHMRASLFSDVTNGMDALDRIQVTTARATFDAAQARFHWFVGVAIAGVLTALGAAAFAWWSLQRAIGAPLAQALDHFRAIADGDLTTQVEVRTGDEMGQLMSGLQAMQRKLVQTIRVVREGSRSIDTAAQEISAGNLDLSQRTEEQAASLEETASSMEELTSTVRQNADNARQANQVVSSTALLTEQGNLAAQEVVQTMRGLSDASGKIAEITGVIEGIAFQTNILSLNAAVEAARAGEQGRGFAVVASEVRSLAQRSATASREIKELIADSLTRVETGARQVDRATQTMADILASVRKVSDLMGEIAAASEEQSKGIEQVNQAVAQMDQVTQQNAALVEQASASALSLKEQAGQLETTVSVFRLQAASAENPLASPRRAAMPVARKAVVSGTQRTRHAAPASTAPTADHS
ncbi:Methyl-accepting chemotaxis protein I [Paraburkholderia ultramafica]|uniref:Methyl-accepting chemotaxis protein I n=1 Tax=Paraburkholderia ultramafica TaxID=1544867 RepID=A0A6S7C1B3_9BURK|nr:methyl-accepting chemotaxis protein [Paraburkholderia ultramafica]CAB3806230.1 Methyl-accepting chemotaxis protein I [Paraburkholderia ultramafica]